VDNAIVNPIKSICKTLIYKTLIYKTLIYATPLSR